MKSNCLVINRIRKNSSIAGPAGGVLGQRCPLFERKDACAASDAVRDYIHLKVAGSNSSIRGQDRKARAKALQAVERNRQPPHGTGNKENKVREVLGRRETARPSAGCNSGRNQLAANWHHDCTASFPMLTDAESKSADTPHPAISNGGLWWTT